MPLDQIDVIGVKEGLDINVFLFENDKSKNYITKYHPNGVFIGVFNNSNAVMLKNDVRSLENGNTIWRVHEGSFKVPGLFEHHNCKSCLTEINCPGKIMVSFKSKYVLSSLVD